MFRNKTLPVFLLSFFSLSVSAATISNESMIGQPLDLVISGKAVKINSCRDLTEATKGGGKIEKVTSQLDNLSNQQANAALLDCSISTQLSKGGAMKVSGRGLTTANAIAHIPASAIPGPSEPASTARISIAKAYPDLKIKGDQATTQKGAMLLRVRDKGEYTSANGKTIHLIDIAMHVTDGTYANTATYVVENDKQRLWQLKPVDYNTRF